MACFADINVSQGSAATHARCGGIFYIHITANLARNLHVKNFLNRLRIDRITVMSLWPRFLAHPVHVPVLKISGKNDGWTTTGIRYSNRSSAPGRQTWSGLLPG